MEEINNKIHSVVFFDLDGTLFDNSGNVPVEVLDVLKKFKTNGILPVIASGRAPFEIIDTLKRTEISSFISLNGSYVVFEKKLICSSSIDVNLIKDLMKKLDFNKEALAFYTKDEKVITNINSNVVKAYQYLHAKLPNVSKDFYKTNGVNMLLLFTDQSKNESSKFDIKQLTFYKNIPWAFDVTNVGVSKYRGIKIFLKEISDDVTTYAFGDGMNDVPMSKAVNHFIAMGNAEDSVKELADFVTSNNDDHGILNGLKHYFLLE